MKKKIRSYVPLRYSQGYILEIDSDVKSFTEIHLFMLVI